MGRRKDATVAETACIFSRPGATRFGLSAAGFGSSALLQENASRREDNAGRVPRSCVHARIGDSFWVAQSATVTMSTVGEVFLNVVAPVMGLTLANVMFFSGVPAMLRCKRDGALGDMNPGPFPVVLANCVGWMGYSLLIHDYFLFFGNAPASKCTSRWSGTGSPRPTRRQGV